MSILKCSIISLFLILSTIVLKAQHPKTDLLDQTLSNWQLDITDLGYQPKTYWTSFPQEVPYKFNAFDQLFAEPLKMYDFTKVISSAVERLLDSSYIYEKNRFLDRLVYYTAISKHVGAFRGYNPIRVIRDRSDESFDQALDLLKETCKKQNKISHQSSDTLIVLASASASFNNLPSPLKIEIADLIYSICDALLWRQMAIRNMDTSQMNKVYRVRDFGLTQPDGMIYYPEFDDCFKDFDKESMFYSSLNLLAGIDHFRYNVDSLLNANDYNLEDIDIEFSTPIGLISIKGTNDDINHSTAEENSLLLIDFGGNDQYIGCFAAAKSLKNPISLVLDFTGNDLYSNNDAQSISQGAGIFGTGILLDMKGDDSYQSINYSQGLGVFGLGLLCDFEGNDEYSMENSGQGCGYFGIGLNYDISGDDDYYLFGDGQGMGGVGGIGILANYSGNDRYTAEADASKCEGRADYHSKGKINANFAQGAGGGRRGDLTDGHNWAGGIGALIDIHGDDYYSAGNFSQAVGYWFGMGILFDGNGDDQFESVYFTRASGAHFAMGVLIDEKGNDRHVLKETGGAGLSFGWDFVNTLFLDAKGDDYYEAKMISLGNSMLRSNTFFFELEGDDIYRCYDQKNFFGASDYQDSFEKPYFSKTYFYEAKQFSFFFDLNGEDQYLIKGKRKNQWSIHPQAENNKKWLQPGREESIKYLNYGIGIDTTSLQLNRFNHWKKDQ